MEGRGVLLEGVPGLSVPCTGKEQVSWESCIAQELLAAKPGSNALETFSCLSVVSFTEFMLCSPCGLACNFAFSLDCPLVKLSVSKVSSGFAGEDC